MVKHGRNKKRRAGRIGKTKIKNRKNFTRWDTNLHKKIKNPTVRENWDPSKSFTANLTAIGLVARPNDDVSQQQHSNNQAVKSGFNVVELFDIPDSDEQLKKGEKRCPLNEEEQIYIVKCMSKYGDDYSKAFRDIKINYLQHTETKLRKLGARFLLLSPEERCEKVNTLIEKA